MEKSDTNKIHDFSWGDTSGIREIMLKHSGHIFYSTRAMPWSLFGYPEHEGVMELRNLTKALIKNLTGREYRYIIITNGALQSLNAYVNSKVNSNTEILYTNNMYFAFYPNIAANMRLKHIGDIKKALNPGKQNIGIIDSPSNPMGDMFDGNSQVKENVVWDAAYFSPTYCGMKVNEKKLKCMPIIPDHDAMAGSFNKLTGINGLRIGWLATNSNIIFNRTLKYIESDTCGVSYPSQWAILQILKYVDLNAFFIESKDMLDVNRNEISRLDHLFSGQPIPDTGMFALFEVDQALKDLLAKANVKTMEGSLCGDTRNSVRFNLAKSIRDTKAMVDAVIRADKV